MPSPSIQSDCSNAGNSGAASFSLPSAPATGNCIVLGVWMLNSGHAITDVVSVTDHASLTAYTGTGWVASSSGGGTLWLYVLPTVPSGSNQVDVVWSGGDFVDLVMVEYPPCGGVRAFAGQQLFVGTHILPQCTISGTSSSDLIVAFGSDGNFVLRTAGTINGVAANHVIDDTLHGNNDPWMIEDGAGGGTGTATFGTTTDDNWVVVMVALLSAAPAGAIAGVLTATTGQSGTLAGSGLLAGVASAHASASAMPFFQLYGSAGEFDYAVAGPAAWFDVDTFTSPVPGPAAGWFDADYLYPSSAAPGALAGTSTATAGQTATLTGAGVLAASSQATAGQTGAVTGAGGLVGTSAAIAGETGALTGSGALAALSTATAGESGTLTQPGLSGTLGATAGQTGALAGAGALLASSAATASQIGTLVQPGLSGTLQAAAGQTGTLAGSGKLAGTSTATAGQSGTLGGSGVLAGASQAAAGQSGNLGGFGALVGVLTAIGNAIGNLVNGGMRAIASAFSDQSGSIAGTGALAGTSGAVAGQSGHLVAGNQKPILGARATTEAMASPEGQTQALVTSSRTTMLPFPESETWPI